MPDDQPQQTAATAWRPMRPTEILGTAFGLYRRRWRTLLAIIALAVPLAVSFPSTKVLPGPGSEYQVIVHHRVVATGGSWAATAVVVVASLAAMIGFAVVAGAVTRAAVAAVAGEGLLLTWLLLGLAANLVDKAAGGFGHGWVAETVAQALAITLVTPFAALVVVLLYLDLRARREELDAGR
jgi:hypothetical protein